MNETIAKMQNKNAENGLESIANTYVLASVKTLVRQMSGNQDPTCDMVIDDIWDNRASDSIVKNGGGYAREGGSNLGEIIEVQLNGMDTFGGVLQVKLNNFTKSKKYNVFSYQLIEFDEKDKIRLWGSSGDVNYKNFDRTMKFDNDKMVTCYLNGNETFIEYSGFENGKKIFLENGAIDAAGKVEETKVLLNKISSISQNKIMELNQSLGKVPN